jgi:hypothetical protein
MKGCEVLRAAKQLSYAYEGEPPQVEQYCPFIWKPPFIKLVEIAKFPKRWVLSKKPVRVPLAAAAASAETKTFAPRLLEASRARGQTTVLQLKGVEADAEPGAVWEVYVGPSNLKPDPTGPYFVGTLGLFGGGIKTRKDHYHPGEFAFPISKAVSAAGGNAKLQVMFVPVSGIEVAGRALPAQPRADVTVAELSIVIDVMMPQPPRDEQEKLRREDMAE